MNIHHSSQPLSLQMRTPSLFLVASRASKNINIFKNVATDPRMENQPSRQCPHCQDLTPCYLFVQVPELLEGAKAGCKGCSLLRGAVSKFFPISKIKAIAVSVDCALYIYAYLKDANEYTVIELSSPAGQPSRWKNIGPARPVLPMTHDRSRVVQLIKNWMEDCQLRHPSCRAPLTAPLPTRVIDVGSSSETVCLHISTEGESGSYVALSHCWGGHIPLATTKATLADHQKSIRFDDESKTFAQAAELTRALGFRYLWCVPHKEPGQGL